MQINFSSKEDRESNKDQWYK